MQTCNILLHDSLGGLARGWRSRVQPWSTGAPAVSWTEHRQCLLGPDKQQSLLWTPHLREPWFWRFCVKTDSVLRGGLEPARTIHPSLLSPYFSHPELSLILYLQLSALRLSCAWGPSQGTAVELVLGGWADLSSRLIGSFFQGTVWDSCQNGSDTWIWSDSHSH